MSEDIASLRQAIEQYETQLSQIQLAVAASAPGSDRDNLMSLKSDIEELILLTKENLSSVEKQATNTQNDDDIDKEYALFKAELEEVEIASGDGVSAETTTNTTPESNIQEELAALQGMKCQAPHKHQWGEVSYHNALVCGAESSNNASSMEHIQVRIMFTNPTHKDMLPCPYYLDGECRFSDDQCHFSHGEVVQLSDLKEYKEPNFTAVRPGARVLVLQPDKLWHRGVVLTCSGKTMCQVKLESSGKKVDADLQHMLPLGEEDEEVTSSDSDSDSDSEEDEDNKEEVAAMLVEKSLLNPMSSALGEWEKHTKGIGSRLMAQMGYVTGSGLGRYGEGRIEPVEVMVFPVGKSLDHCMQLRENAGGDKDLFKVEKRLKRLQQKHQEQSERQYEREKQRTNVFDFINSKLGYKQEVPESTSRTSNKVLKSESCKGLNVVGFRVGEEIRRAEKDLARLQQSLSRHAVGSQTHNAIASKVGDKQGELARLRASEHSINKERNQRKNCKKMSIF